MAIIIEGGINIGGSIDAEVAADSIN